jgi:hypothetical protein
MHAFDAIEDETTPDRSPLRLYSSIACNTYNVPVHLFWTEEVNQLNMTLIVQLPWGGQRQFRQQHTTPALIASYQSISLQYEMTGKTGKAV